MCDERYQRIGTSLDVYNESQRLLPELYELVKEVPRSELDLEWQIKRAAKSISANIAEGFGKVRTDTLIESL